MRGRKEERPGHSNRPPICCRSFGRAGLRKAHRWINSGLPNVIDAVVPLTTCDINEELSGARGSGTCGCWGTNASLDSKTMVPLSTTAITGVILMIQE